MNDPHEQIVQRERELKEAMTPDFIAHLENASKVISTWPKWKQELADKILRPTPQPEQRMEPSYLSPTEREAWIGEQTSAMLDGRRVDLDAVVRMCNAIRDIGKRLDDAKDEKQNAVYGLLDKMDALEADRDHWKDAWKTTQAKGELMKERLDAAMKVYRACEDYLAPNANGTSVHTLIACCDEMRKVLSDTKEQP